MPPIVLALFSNISFATASLTFAEYSKKVSASWMNYYKAVIALICFSSACLLLNYYVPLSDKSIAFLCLSGSMGLFIGDIFLLKAFAHLGSGRVLMIFGFQPLVLGAASFYLFGQDFPPARLIAVLLLMGCLFTFSFESFRKKGHWDLPGLGFALLGVGLDAGGLLLTKATFEMNPNLSAIYANVFRSGVAVLGFIILSQIPWMKLSLLEPLKKLNRKQKIKVTFASFLGTFFSLVLYLTAIKRGHLATVSAVAGTSPLFATLFETITGKKKLTAYLLVGVGFFVSGFLVLTLT
jgi:drug/metabolite transporter (DMT)-like permease